MTFQIDLIRIMGNALEESLLLGENITNTEKGARTKYYLSNRLLVDILSVLGRTVFGDPAYDSHEALRKEPNYQNFMDILDSGRGVDSQDTVLETAKYVLARYEELAQKT